MADFELIIKKDKINNYFVEYIMKSVFRKYVKLHYRPLMKTIFT